MNTRFRFPSRRGLDTWTIIKTIHPGQIPYVRQVFYRMKAFNLWSKNGIFHQAGNN
jgi:hypothetical protein